MQNRTANEIKNIYEREEKDSVKTNEKKKFEAKCVERNILYCYIFGFYLHPQSVRTVRPTTAETQS